MAEKTNFKRMLFIGPYPPPFAGPEMVTKMFLESSLKDDFEIYFLNTNVRKSNAKKGKIGLVLIWAFFRFVFLLIYMIIRHRPKVAYYSVTATQLGWIGRDIWCIWICYIFRVKIAIHLQCSHFRLNYKRFNPIAKYLIRWACKTVSAAIVLAENLTGQFEGLTHNDRIRILYEGIDSSKYDNPDLDRYQRSKVLFIGHLTKAKGYIDVLHSMKSVVAKCPESQFYFIGTIFKGQPNIHFNQYTGTPLVYEDPYIMREEIQSGPLNQHYHELNMLSEDELVNHLRSADIFVLPSYSEGFSIALIEAMSVGKPTVFTPVGGHPAILKHEVNGLMCDPGNVGKLTENIIRLLQDKTLRDRIAKNNYEFIRNNLDIDIIANGLSKILHDCIV